MGKIRFVNFRCFVDHTFAFPEKGLVLLDGVSGAGKSSFVMGVLHALYGKLKKPTHFLHPQTTSKIELEWFDVKIVRTNKPNILKLTQNGITTEDEVAQSLIDKRFGTFEEFIVSSYIPQKNNTSILSLTPTDQLKVVQSIAFNAEDSEKRKDVIKEKIRMLSKTISEWESELKFSQQELDKLKIITPSRIFSKEEIVDAETFWESYGETLKKLQDKIRQLKKLERKREIIQELEQIPKEIDGEIQESLKRQLAQLQANQKWTEWNETLQEHMKSEEEEWKKELQERIAKKGKETKKEVGEKLEKLHKQLEEFSIYQQQEKIKTEISRETKFGSCLRANLQKQLTKTMKTLDDVEVEIQIHLQKMELATAQSMAMKCPHCSNTLRVDLTTHSLHPFQQPTEDLSSYTTAKLKEWNSKKQELLAQKGKWERYLIKLEFEDVEPVENPSLTIQKWMAYLEKQEGLEKEIKLLTQKIEKKIYSAITDQLRKKRDSAKYLDCPGNLEDVQSQWDQYQLDGKRQKEWMVKSDALQRELTGLGDLTDEYHPEDLVVATQQYDFLQSDFTKYNQQQKDLQIYQKFLDVQTVKENWDQKIQELTEKLKESQKINVAWLKLKQKYQEAEMVAIESTVMMINQFTSDYLQRFFTDVPFSALLTQEDVGKMNVEITYKNHKYDSLSQLSGGEFDKCTLASVCGINELLGSKILILDESLASLDSENNTDALQTLQELGKEKLILTASHEAVRGIFDFVLDVVV